MQERIETFLLGYAYCTLKKAQDKIAQDLNKEALTEINDSMRYLNSELEKYFSPKDTQVQLDGCCI